MAAQKKVFPPINPDSQRAKLANNPSNTSYKQWAQITSWPKTPGQWMEPCSCQKQKARSSTHTKLMNDKFDTECFLQNRGAKAGPIFHHYARVIINESVDSFRSTMGYKVSTNRFFYMYAKPTKWILTSHSARPKCHDDVLRAGWGRTKICPKIKEISQHEPLAEKPPLGPPPPRIAHTFAGWFMACLCSTDLATSNRKTATTERIVGHLGNVARG